LFNQQCPQLMGEVRDAIDHRNSSALNRTAHQLKGSLLSLGAVRASKTAQQMETLGKDGMLNEAAAWVANLTSEIEQFQTALDEFHTANRTEDAT
jgi:HPt (histidine-containing phosphotransfer) domain-containing protein